MRVASPFASHDFSPAARAMLLVGLLVAAPTAGAAPQKWSKMLGTPLNEQARDGTSDGAGGVVVVGGTTGSLAAPHQGNWDAFAARFAADGSLLWKHQMGTSTTDWCTGVAQDGLGGFFVAGETWGSLASAQIGMGDAFLARYDSVGNPSWIQQYGTSKLEWDVRVASDGAGGVFLACTSGDAWMDTREIRVLRIDGNGTVLWTQVFGSAQADVLGHVVADGSGGAFLCGGTNGALAQPSQGAFDAWLAHMDSAGTILWIVQEGTSGHDAFNRLVVDGQGHVYLAGYIRGNFEGFLANQADVVVARYEAGGAHVWSKTFGTPMLERTSGLAPDGSGGVIVMGETQSALHGPALGGLGDVWLQRLQEDGTQAWAQQFGTTQPDWGGIVCAVGPKRFVAIGQSSGNIFGQTNQGNGDVFVALYDECSFPNVTSYCPANVNSTGAPAVLSSKGSTSIAANDLEFHVAGAKPGDLGVLLMGLQEFQLPMGDGKLCLLGNIQRFLPPLLISPQGSATISIDFLDPTQPASQIPPGATRYFQFSYRDTGSVAAGFNFSNGLEATFCP